MAEDEAAAEERRRRAQARKDKISAKGKDRLAKITGAAKGEGEGGERFGTGGASELQFAYDFAMCDAHERHDVAIRQLRLDR